MLQRRILKRDPSRARVVAGEPAKVSELRQQWNDTTVGENPREFAHFVIRRAMPGHRTRRVAVARAGIQITAAGQAGDAWRRRVSVRAWSRFPARPSRTAGKMLDELVHRMEPVLRRPHPVVGPGDLQPGIRPQHRLRPRRDRIDAARAGNSPGGAAVLAPVLPRRCDRAGGDAGEPAAAGAHVRRNQPVVRVHGAADAPLRRHLHPAQARRPAVQVRAAAVRRLHRREAVQPHLVDRGHPVAHRKDVAAQARSDGAMSPTPTSRVAATTSCCSRCRSASTSCTKPPNTPRTPAAARRRPRGCRWLYNFIKAQGERNYGKIYVRFPEAVSMRQYLGEPGGPIAKDDSRETSCDAEDGDRGGLADPAGHAGQRDRIGVGAAVDHPRDGADAGSAAPHVAGLAGLSGAQADPDDQQRVAVTHRRRRPGRTGRAVQRPSGHLGRRWA